MKPSTWLCLILALVSFCTVVQASKKLPLTASSVVPAARGYVEIDRDKNGNVRVKKWNIWQIPKI